MEKRQPWISVVMPVYNAQDYLADSIESVLNQSFRDLELIVVDDCPVTTAVKSAKDMWNRTSGYV